MLIESDDVKRWGDGSEEQPVELETWVTLMSGSFPTKENKVCLHFINRTQWQAAIMAPFIIHGPYTAILAFLLPVSCIDLIIDFQFSYTFHA
jgi:hypothetical protein